jgi:hypothetical protein
MPAEAPVCAQSPLKIDRTVLPQSVQVRASDRFLEQIEGQAVATA